MYNRNNNTLAHIMWNRKYYALSFFAFSVEFVLVILNTVTVAACSDVNSNFHLFKTSSSVKSSFEKKKVFLPKSFRDAPK